MVKRSSSSLVAVRNGQNVSRMPKSHQNFFYSSAQSVFFPEHNKCMKGEKPSMRSPLHRAPRRDDKVDLKPTSSSTGRFRCAAHLREFTSSPADPCTLFYGSFIKQITVGIKRPPFNVFEPQTEEASARGGGEGKGGGTRKGDKRLQIEVGQRRRRSHLSYETSSQS